MGHNHWVLHDLFTLNPVFSVKDLQSHHNGKYPLLKSYLFSTIMKCFLGSLKDKKQGFLILRLQKLGEEHSRKREHMCTGPKQGIWLLQGTYPWAREQYKNKLDGRSVTDHTGNLKSHENFRHHFRILRSL